MYTSGRKISYKSKYIIENTGMEQFFVKKIYYVICFYL